jgi:hypothetical protein
MRIFLPIAALFLTTSSLHAQEFTSPDDLMSALYNQYLGGQPVTNFEPYFSDDLTEKTHGAKVPQAALKKLGLDPITGMSEPHLMTVFNLETLETTGPTATSTATFKADGTVFVITFGLVHEADHGWQIEHISGKAGETSWCTNDLIAAIGSSAPG